MNSLNIKMMLVCYLTPKNIKPFFFKRNLYFLLKLVINNTTMFILFFCYNNYLFCLYNSPETNVMVLTGRGGGPMPPEGGQGPFGGPRPPVGGRGPFGRSEGPQRGVEGRFGGPRPPRVGRGTF